MTYVATLSHLRRVNTPIEKTGKLVQPRKLHPTQWGVICPSECFDPETPILTWKGAIKEAKDIIVGDFLIDDIGNAVRVKSTCSGFKRMYEVIPDKDNFMSYTVTDNHILTLKVKRNIMNRNYRGKRELSWFDKKELRYTYKYFDNEDERMEFRSSLDDDNTIDITIEKYMSLPKNVQKNLYVFKSAGINWEKEEVALDPYILGMWLGDGLSSGYAFVTADKELLEKWIEWGADNDATIKKGHKYKFGISSTINNTQPGINCNKTEQAPLKKLLAKYGLVKNKHIPLDYLVNDRATRLAVLAGLVDTDGNVRAKGHEIRITQGEKNYRILYDAEFLARSLGFSCHVNGGMCTYTVKGEKRQKPYKELRITGFKLYEIPTVLSRKKLNKFNDPVTEKRCNGFLQSSFKLVEKDVQPFVGWQVEGNGRFLLGDMSITHNTPEGASVGLVKNLALLANVTVASSSDDVRAALPSLGARIFEPGVDKPDDVFSGGATRIFVNGDLVGSHRRPAELFAELRAMKRRGALGSVFTSVVWNVQLNDVIVCSEGGRFVRPLLVVGDGRRLGLGRDLAARLVRGPADVDWATDLVLPGIVEYLDVDESGTSMIALMHGDLAGGGGNGGNGGGGGGDANKLPPRYTHMEIDPCAMLGVVAGSIPFSDHNQVKNSCDCDPNTLLLSLHCLHDHLTPSCPVLGVGHLALVPLHHTHTPVLLRIRQGHVEHDLHLRFLLDHIGQQQCCYPQCPGFAGAAPTENARPVFSCTRVHSSPKLTLHRLAHRPVLLGYDDCACPHTPVRIHKSCDVRERQLRLDLEVLDALQIGNDPLQLRALGMDLARLDRVRNVLPLVSPCVRGLSRQIGVDRGDADLSLGIGHARKHHGLARLFVRAPDGLHLGHPPAVERELERLDQLGLLEEHEALHALAEVERGLAAQRPVPFGLEVALARAVAVVDGAPHEPLEMHQAVPSILRLADAHREAVDRAHPHTPVPVHLAPDPPLDVIRQLFEIHPPLAAERAGRTHLLGRDEAHRYLLYSYRVVLPLGSVRRRAH